MPTRKFSIGAYVVVVVLGARSTARGHSGPSTPEATTARGRAAGSVGSSPRRAARALRRARQRVRIQPTAGAKVAGRRRPTVVASPADPDRVVFAVIGDYGSSSPAEADVARLVEGWSPDFVATVGDNNYPIGAAATIDKNIGRFYHRFIHPYRGQYGEGADTNRFFPSLGNHDTIVPGAAPYLAYFDLPGNERYYDLVRGPVHLFALNSDTSEPDGVTPASQQGAWLKSRLEASRSPWKIVYFHHAPLSSGPHGGTEHMRWPFDAWGAHAVITGHDHHYERLEQNGIPYFVNGIGGKGLRPVETPSRGSAVRYYADYGAMRVSADAHTLSFEAITRAGHLIDKRTITKAAAAPTTARRERRAGTGTRTAAARSPGT